MFRWTSVAVLGLVACHSANHAPSGAASRAAPVVSAEPVVSFPHRPPRCDYQLPAVSPGVPAVNPHREAYGRAPRVRNLHITFVGDPSTSAVIQWSTDDRTLASSVQYGPAGGPLTQTALGYSFTYRGSGSEGRREHEVHLCGLTPGTRYTYLAGGAPGRSQPYSFVTAPAGPAEVRFIVAGDARTDPATWGVIARSASAEHADAMLFSGDAVADGASQPLWDEFFAASPDFFATHPVLWSDGNHEGISEVYYAQFALPGNGDPLRHERWYTLRYGPLTVIALNDTTVSRDELTGPETTWLRSVLSTVDRTRTPYVVTLHHKPMYTTSVGHLPDEVTLRAWEPLFNQFHVNVDLAGHVHNYESTLPIYAGAVVPAAQGTRYFIFGGGGAPLYPFRSDEPWVLHHEIAHGYAVLTASPWRFQWVAHRADGSVIETVDLLL